MKKTAIGLGLALICMFCITVTAFINDNSYFQENRRHIAACLAVVGFLSLVFGQLLAIIDRIQRHSRGVRGQREIFPLFNLKFWGVVLLILAALTPIICPVSEMVEMARNSKHFGQAAEWVQATLQRDSSPEATEPEFRLQGIVITPGSGQSSTIINGQSLHVGDEIAGARIVAIRRYGVELQVGDQVKLLGIKDWSQVSVSEAQQTSAARVN